MQLQEIDRLIDQKHPPQVAVLTVHLDEECGICHWGDAIVGVARVGGHLVARDVCELDELSTDGAHCRVE